MQFNAQAVTLFVLASLVVVTQAWLNEKEEDSILRQILQSYDKTSAASSKRPASGYPALWNKRGNVKALNIDPAYNECPEAEPFPCKTKVMECISLKHVCDGNRDCADGWDEDEGVCIAYQRVPAEDLIKFVQQQAYWLVPSFFTSIVTKPEDLNAIASALSTSANLDNFSRTLGLNRPDAKKFQSALYAVRGNDMRTLESFGMDPDSWTEVKIVFKNLIDSGLL